MKMHSLITRVAGTAAAVISISLASAQTVSSSTGAVQTQSTNAALKAPALSYGAFQAVDMYQRGIRADTIVGYIKNSSAPYQLSADAILYMKSLGIPKEIVNAMLQRDIQLRDQDSQPETTNSQVFFVTPPYEDSASLYPVTPSENPPVSPPAAAVIPDDSYVPNDYPDYDEYWPPIVIGGGWGWTGGHRWGHDHWGFGRGSHGGFGGGFHGGFGGGHGGGGHR